MTSSSHHTSANSSQSASKGRSAQASLLASPPSPQLYHCQWLPGPSESYLVTASSGIEEPDPVFFHSMEDLYKMACVKGDLLDIAMLEEVLARMRCDRKTYDRQESPLKHSIVKPPSTSPKSMHHTTASIKKEPRDKKRPPPPSLAATHPAMYKPLPPTQTGMDFTALCVKREHVKLVPEAPVKVEEYCSINEIIKREPGLQSPPHCAKANPSLQQVQRQVHAEQDTIPPWQLYTDANRIYSVTPNYPDPKPRHLVNDTRSDVPAVLSPVFCVGLPLGSVVEIADPYYPDDGAQ